MYFTILIISFITKILSACEISELQYSEDDMLTKVEQIELMDKALLKSLEDFEECLQSKNDGVENVLNKNNDISKSVSNNKLSGENSSNLEGERTEILEDYDESLEVDVPSIKNRILGNNGKLPEDIPIDDNDNRLGQQIKDAALSEDDPILKKRLWNEYRRYKNLPIE